MPETYEQSERRIDAEELNLEIAYAAQEAASVDRGVPFAAEACVEHLEWALATATRLRSLERAAATPARTLGDCAPTEAP